MDFRAVGQILAGLCQCGAWGCFDEFNRIDISVLSVISTQLQCIRSALLMKLKRFTFEGQEIAMDSKVGIFITMNPGYAGRTELPESVKALFRPVVCILPDLEMICQISLFSDGFLTAKVLAKKMTVLYKVAREQLSKQSHYDWGLRALTAVLRMAGKLRRDSPGLSEIMVLMRALSVGTAGKLTIDSPGLSEIMVLMRALRSDYYILVQKQGNWRTIVQAVSQRMAGKLRRFTRPERDHGADESSQPLNLGAKSLSWEPCLRLDSYILVQKQGNSRIIVQAVPQRMAGKLRRDSPLLSESMRYEPPEVRFRGRATIPRLIKDLFPGLECPRVGYPEFNATVIDVLEKDGYIVLPHQVDKVVQLYETMMTRHCTMLVGPTGGGKTVILQTIVKAQTNLGLPTKLTVLNPKACSVIELYGILDPVTRDWTDGLYSKIFREMNRPADKDERRYSLFDGDVDALWIENMNSVMDDNRLLTLANGERIRLAPYCSLLFEVGDLNYASPATVSRAGMVFVDPKNLGYQPYWE
ncbi:hypothetical protein evm_015266, partial [Chilo suppressalis]